MAPADLGVWYNLSSQVLSITTRYRIVRHCYAAPSVELPVCVAVRCLTLRTGCEKHGRKNPLSYPISERSHIGNLRQIRKQGKGRSSKRKGNRRCPFLFAHRRGYGVVPCRGRGSLPRSAERNSLAEPQRKTCRPDRVNRLRGPSTPAFRCRKRSCPLGPNTLARFACPA